MKYIVLEIQTSIDNTVSILSYQFDNKQEAESKFHLVLSFAAVSQLPCHTAILLTNTGDTYDMKSYKHVTE